MARKPNQKKAPRPNLKKKKTPDLLVQRCYQLRIELIDVRPTVWRRFVVPDWVKLSDLHRILQAVMGWDDCHLHSFNIGADEYGPPDPEGSDPATKNEGLVRLHEVAPDKGTVFFYGYDPGDGWSHRVCVEEIRSQGLGPEMLACLEGARACPLEDCGGPPGHMALVTALVKGPSDVQGKELLKWAGAYDPDKFDIASVNGRLKMLRWESR